MTALARSLDAVQDAIELGEELDGVTVAELLLALGAQEERRDLDGVGPRERKSYWESSDSLSSPRLLPLGESWSFASWNFIGSSSESLAGPVTEPSYG